MLFKYIGRVLPLALFVSCTSAPEPPAPEAPVQEKLDTFSLKSQDSLAEIELDAPWSEGDTFFVNAPVLILFYPTETELKKFKDPSFVEAQADFEYYTQILLDQLRKKGDQAYLNSSRYVRIRQKDGSSKLFDKKQKPVAYGFVMSNGKQDPYAEWGIFPDKDILYKWQMCLEGKSPDPAFREI